MHDIWLGRKLKNKRSREGAMADNDLWKLGALKERRTLDAGWLRSGWLWRACLERIEERESAVRAFVHPETAAAKHG